MIDHVILLCVLILMHTREAIWMTKKTLVVDNFSLEEDWFVGKQYCISQSTLEAEYVVAINNCNQIMWMK